jgi:uncharacterized membrane protein YdfJ with MMPL/SSD domain
MGIAGVFVALIAAAIALTVLPAVLTLLGLRVNMLAPGFLARRAERDARPAQQGFWYRLARLVMHFPGRTAATTAALLIALGLPFLDVTFTSVDAQVLPESASARHVDDRMRADFLSSQIVITKELGLGTATAVLLDASIVRALLVPSLMRLLGRWNWWAPAPLRRLHARIGLSEA